MDRRTKRQKLQAMANQSVSPNEAEIAKKKLEELGKEEISVKNGDTISFTISFTMGGPTVPSGRKYQDPMDEYMDGIFIFENGEFKRYPKK